MQAAEKLDLRLVPIFQRFTALLELAHTSKIAYPDLQKQCQRLGTELNALLEPHGFLALPLTFTADMQPPRITAFFQMYNIVHRRNYEIRDIATGETFQRPVRYLRPVLENAMSLPQLAQYIPDWNEVHVYLDALVKEMDSLLLPVLDDNLPLMSTKYGLGESMDYTTVHTLLHRFRHLLTTQEVGLLESLGSKIQDPITNGKFLSQHETEFARILNHVLGQILPMDPLIRQGVLERLKSYAEPDDLNKARTFARSEGGRQRVVQLLRGLAARLLMRRKEFSIRSDLSKPLDDSIVAEVENDYRSMFGTDGLAQFMHALRGANERWSKGYSQEEEGAFTRALEVLSHIAADGAAGMEFFEAYWVQKAAGVKGKPQLTYPLLQAMKRLAGAAYFSSEPKAGLLTNLTAGMILASAPDELAAKTTYEVFVRTALPGQMGASMPATPAEVTRILQSTLALDTDQVRARLQAALNDPAIPEVFRIPPGSIHVSASDRMPGSTMHSVEPPDPTQQYL